MNHDPANLRIEAFRQKFGESHYIFAAHAAFPLAMTPDILYRLWATFQMDEQGQPLRIPWLAVADLLLSSLYREVGHELFEMNLQVQQRLLANLRDNPRFGPNRIRALSAFVAAYYKESLGSPYDPVRRLAGDQVWFARRIALAYIDPAAAANNLAKESEKTASNEKNQLIRLAALEKILAEPLKEYSHKRSEAVIQEPSQKRPEAVIPKLSWEVQQVLILCDNSDLSDIIIETLETWREEKEITLIITLVSSIEEGWKKLDSDNPFNFVITRLEMPPKQNKSPTSDHLGLKFIQEMRKCGINFASCVLTEFMDIELYNSTYEIPYCELVPILGGDIQTNLQRGLNKVYSSIIAEQQSPAIKTISTTTSPLRQSNIHHALGLHMHQPPGNLKLLIDISEFEAEQVIRCYEREVRYAHYFADVGRLHVSFSGVLLEQFQDPEIVDRYRRFIDIPAMLESYRSATNIEIIGMGYSHPIFPLIPIEDWKEQLSRDCKIMQKVFGRTPRGFWPPEMAFCMEMVPALVEAGYTYVIVDGALIQPQDGNYDMYRPYKATYNGKTIAVVPWERAISNVQESGMDQKWFADQVADRVQHSPHPKEPRLVTTWSNGENGGWFLQMHEESGFFGHFFKPYLEGVKSGDIPIQPVLLGEYLEKHPPVQEAVRVGTWNVASASGGDFSRWIKSKRQHEAVKAIHNASKRYWTLANLVNKTGLSADVRSKLAKARDLILESETSDFLFGGDTWVFSTKFKECIGSAEELLTKAEASVNP